jgi:hypothetical protein
VDRGAEVQPDLADRQLVGDIARVGQRTSETVELGDDERVAGAARGERFAQPGSLAVPTG